MLGFDYQKAVQVLNYFANKDNGTIDKMKVIKLIWLSDRAHLRQYGRPVLRDEYYAMKYGPVPSNTADLASNNEFLDDPQKNYRNDYLDGNTHERTIRSIKEVDLSYFSESDIEIMDKVYSKFGEKEQFDLSNISHNYPEWKQFEGALRSGSSRIKINYYSFFEDSEEDDDFFNLPKEHLKLSKMVFKERESIYELVND
ncbi:MAG: SocA family protein [Bacteroidales bacterium]|nr:SocA family protein [Bacteroidales bacterium]MCF8336777.1 SocA family protein [Bacteroidales bacterium]